MKTIDMTPGKKTFLVPTAVIRDGISYMGPEVKIQANSGQDARERVQKEGYTPNSYFPPREIKSWRRR